jgi:predicted nucleotidyltransferase
MRLDDFEQHFILQMVREFDPNAEIRLFGSRVDDNRKGGDIDLLVISETLTYPDKLLIRSRLKEKLGARKIDLIITKKPESAFVKSAFDNSVVI